MSHTPGPWTVRVAQLDEEETFVTGESSFVAQICRDTHFGEANARLIACAPELLAACKAIVKGYEVQGLPTPAAIDDVIDAIAAAEGRG